MRANDRNANVSILSSTNEGTCLACLSVSRILLLPATRLSRSCLPLYGHRLAMDRVRSYSHERLQTFPTLPRRAILGDVLPHATGVLHLGRFFGASFRCIQTAPDTWTVWKGTSLPWETGDGREESVYARASQMNLIVNLLYFASRDN